MTDSEPNLKAMYKIKVFTSELNKCFGDKYPTLKKYSDLVRGTKMENERAIHNHNRIFLDYLSKNKDAIKEEDETKLNNDSIKFNDKIYIPLRELLMNNKDKDTKNVIFKHCQAIYLYLCPEDQELGDIKQALLASKNKKGSKEESLLENMVTKLTSKYANGDGLNDLLGTFGSISSGGGMDSLQNTSLGKEITDQLSEEMALENIDEGNLLTGAQSIVNKLKGQLGDDNSMAPMFSLIDNLMSKAMGELNQ